MFSADFTYHSDQIRSTVAVVLRSSIVLNLLLVSAWVTAEAQMNSRGIIEIEQGGKLWIEGSASVVDYTCKAEQLSGYGNIANRINPQENVKGHGAVSISVEIPVRSLECGKKAMNRDMYQALKAKEYPYIGYHLLSATLVDTTRSSQAEEADWMDIKTLGVLKVAGVEDTALVIVKAKLLSEDRFRVKGSKLIRMQTYDINPPSHLFGIIKASNELTVHFDVTVRLKKI